MTSRMCRQAAAALTVLLCAAACSVAPRAPDCARDVVWMDRRRSDTNLELGQSVGQRHCSRWTPEASSQLQVPAHRAGSRSGGEARLLTIALRPDMEAFAYAGGHSTPAADTWRNQRGDCLSLSVLSVATGAHAESAGPVAGSARAVSFDRRGDVDFLDAHVKCCFATAAHCMPLVAAAHDVADRLRAAQRTRGNAARH